jgi:hypothetical protein
MIAPLRATANRIATLLAMQTGALRSRAIV